MSCDLGEDARGLPIRARAVVATACVRDRNPVVRIGRVVAWDGRLLEILLNPNPDARSYKKRIYREPGNCILLGNL